MFLVTTTTNNQTICSIAQHFYLQHYSLSLIYWLFNLYGSLVTLTILHWLQVH